MLKNLFVALKWENLKDMMLRFPISFVLSVVTSLILIIYVNAWIDSECYNNMVLKVVFTFSLVFFLSLGVYLSLEDSKLSENKKSLFQIFPAAFWWLFYYFFEVDFTYYDNLVFFLICLVGISSFVFFSPFVKNCKKWTDNNLYYQYFFKTASVFAFGIVLWLLLFALGSLAVLAVNLLFDLSWDFTDKIYKNWAVISLSFITPLVCLIQFPRNNQKSDKSFDINVFSAFIIKYVLPIAVFVYFLILYSYSIKVLLNFHDWPRQEVTSLVIAFSITWYITYILTYYFEKTKALSIFRKAFPFVVLPQLFMLFYAIYLRIAQYDITINRYFVVVFWIWLLVISLYFGLSKKKSLIWVTAILTLFTIIISIWPWSVFSLPETRQMARLKTNLEKAWILVNWEIKPLNEYTDIDKELSKQIYDWIQYVCYNLDCDPVMKLFGKDKDKFTKWEVVNKITQEIKVMTYYWTETAEETKSIYISSDEKWIYPIDIKWYDKMATFFTKDMWEDIATEPRYSDMALQINMEWKYVSVIEKNKIVENIPIEWLSDMLIKRYQDKYWINLNETSVKWQNWLSKEDLTFDFEWSIYSIRLIIESYSTNIDSNWLKTYEYINWYWLVKTK